MQPLYYLHFKLTNLKYYRNKKLCTKVSVAPLMEEDREVCKPATARSKSPNVPRTPLQREIYRLFSNDKSIPLMKV